MGLNSKTEQQCLLYLPCVLGGKQKPAGLRAGPGSAHTGVEAEAGTGGKGASHAPEDSCLAVSDTHPSQPMRQKPGWAMGQEGIGTCAPTAQAAITGWGTQEDKS